MLVLLIIFFINIPILLYKIFQDKNIPETFICVSFSTFNIIWYIIRNILVKFFTDLIAFIEKISLFSEYRSRYQLSRVNWSTDQSSDLRLSINDTSLLLSNPGFVHDLQVWTLATSGTVDALYHPSCRSLFFSLSLAKGGHTLDPRRRPHEFQGSMRRCTKTPALLLPFSYIPPFLPIIPSTSVPPSSSGGGGGGSSNTSSSSSSGSGNTALPQSRYRHQYKLQGTLLPTPVLRRWQCTPVIVWPYRCNRLCVESLFFSRA